MYLCVCCGISKMAYHTFIEHVWIPRHVPLPHYYYSSLFLCCTVFFFALLNSHHPKTNFFFYFYRYMWMYTLWISYWCCCYCVIDRIDIFVGFVDEFLKAMLLFFSVRQKHLIIHFLCWWLTEWIIWACGFKALWIESLNSDWSCGNF